MKQAGVTRDMLPERPVGLFYAWWRGDVLPPLQPPEAMTIEFDPPLTTMQRIVDLNAEQLEERFRRGNRAVVGWAGTTPAGIGWSSSGRVEIGELGLDFDLPPGNRYLWDFVTLPEWRGRGIYPGLLQAFIKHEPDVERFWVGHDLDNIASSRGILKAGFQTVGEVFAVDGVGPVYAAGGTAPERAVPAAALLGIPLLDASDYHKDTGHS